MNTTPLNPPKSIRQQAQDEIDRENAAKAIDLLKTKLRQRNTAQLVVDNIDREIEGLEAQIKQGDIPA